MYFVHILNVSKQFNIIGVVMLVDIFEENLAPFRITSNTQFEVSFKLKVNLP